jgi:hypothetical protein
MAGITGLVQKLMGREVYDKHVCLTLESLIASHNQAGLTVLDAGYLEFLNFGVIKIGTSSDCSFYFIKAILHKILLGITFGVWFLETVFGSFTPNSSTSPHIYCISIKSV